MSPASYLTAPPRVVAENYSASIAAMPSLAIWLALAFFLACGSAGVAFAAIRALRVWRDLRGLKKRLSEGLGQLADSAAEVERRLSSGLGGTEELGAALGRLADSRRQLAILIAATQDASSLLGRISAVYPRK
jgi:hypothetical protein